VESSLLTQHPQAARCHLLCKGWDSDLRPAGKGKPSPWLLKVSRDLTSPPYSSVILYLVMPVGLWGKMSLPWLELTARDTGPRSSLYAGRGGVVRCPLHPHVVHVHFQSSPLVVFCVLFSIWSWTYQGPARKDKPKPCHLDRKSWSGYYCFRPLNLGAICYIARVIGTVFFFFF
jgi:hypothetical protein